MSFIKSLLRALMTDAKRSQSINSRNNHKRDITWSEIEPYYGEAYLYIYGLLDKLESEEGLTLEEFLIEFEKTKKVYKLFKDFIQSGIMVDDDNICTSKVYPLMDEFNALEEYSKQYR